MITAPYSTYLSPAYCAENLVTEIIILNEGIEVDKEFNGKKSKALELSVQVAAGKDPSKPIKDWTLNGTSHASLISVFGNETKNWIGKRVAITVNKTSTNKDAIYVDKVRTQTANPVPAEIPKS